MIALLLKHRMVLVVLCLNKKNWLTLFVNWELIFNILDP